MKFKSDDFNKKKASFYAYNSSNIYFESEFPAANGFISENHMFKCHFISTKPNWCHNYYFPFITVLYQKRFKKERKLRARIQQKLDAETKRRNQIEDALKASGAPAEALRLLSGKLLPNSRSIFFLLFWFSVDKLESVYLFACLA